METALKEHSPSVQLLLQTGADYSKPNIYTGRNVLHTSVAYNQCSIVHELLRSGNSCKLVDLIDHRGDTPLMLAVRLSCLDCVQQLIKFMKPGQEVNKFSEESILHLAVKTGEDDILKHILLFSNEKLLNHRDFDGMTPLLLAIEQFKDTCLERLIKSQNIYIKNLKTHETALHTAVRVDNRLALSLLLFKYNHVMSWCFSQTNREGKTAFWVAIEIGHAPFVVESRKRGWVNVEELNEHGDSTVFVAAACGHLKVLKALLLSERYYEFCRDHERDTDLKEERLIRNAEICCDIYTTDIFILTNKTRKNKSHTWIPKCFLSSNRKTGRNIFHACALGGNVLCLDFVHSLCTSFNLGSSMFDSPDINGNTPLMLATTNDLGGSACVYFFLCHGANISSCNNSGSFVLKSLLVYTEESVDIIETVLNESISYEQTGERGLQESEFLQVDFSLFRPPNEPVTKVVKLFYDTIRGPQRSTVLQHSLFKIYIQLILTSINYFFIARFALSCFTIVVLTVYLIFFSGQQDVNTYKPMIVNSIHYVLLTLSVLGILFSVPLLFNEKILSINGALTFALMLLPCSLTIVLILCPYGSDIAFDIASLAVLVSWLSLLMYSTAVFKDISHQIAMLTQVITGMMVYSRVVILTILPFSLAFYCIFNDHFYFVNPVKAFIYTSFILLQGDTIQSVEYFEAKHFSLGGKKNPLNTSNIGPLSPTVVSQLDFFFEGMFLIIFLITCILGLLNMMVGLAVRDGKTLAVDGEVFRSHLQIHWLNSLENFLKSFLYRILLKTRLIYLFGIIPSRTLFKLRSKYSPTVKRQSYVFSNKSIIDMKKSVRKSSIKDDSSKIYYDNANISDSFSMDSSTFLRKSATNPEDKYL